MFYHVRIHKYETAGSVLRMFRYAVGEEIFKDALKLYLEEK